MDALPANLRLLLVHKQKTSARVRFLRLPHGMCAFDPLPEAAELAQEGIAPSVVLHPSAGLRQAEQRLGLASGSLQAEPEFDAMLRCRTGALNVRLARFVSEDPPFDAAARAGGRFVAITETRDVGALELELLRRAYVTLMG